MTKTNFCELSDVTSNKTFPWDFGTTWNFLTKPGLIVAELRLAIPRTCLGFCSTYILRTHLGTKCILSLGAGYIYCMSVWRKMLNRAAKNEEYISRNL